MRDSELITIEQALRLARWTAEQAKHSSTLGKVNDALAIVQAIPHSPECDCDYCHERREKADPLVRFSFKTSAICSVSGCGFYRLDGSDYCASHG